MSAPPPSREEPIFVGCDVGGTAVKLVCLRGEAVIERLEVPTPTVSDGAVSDGAVSDGRGFVDALAGAILSAASRARAKGRARLAAVGVALPGFLDPSRDSVVYLSNVPALNGVPLRRELSQRIGAPVLLDTDTNAGATGEAHLGAGRGFDRVLYLTLGTGLGAALIVKGEPVRVSRHTVGQAAHLPLGFAGARGSAGSRGPAGSRSSAGPRGADGPPCRCGERGCAEAVLSARGILWRARWRHGLLGIASTRELSDLARGRVEPQEARVGPARYRGRASRCAAARRVWRETGEAAGVLCVILGALFSPEAIVLGGGVAQAGDLLIPWARRAATRRLERRLGRPTAIRGARLGRYAGAVGAALLARGLPASGSP